MSHTFAASAHGFPPHPAGEPGVPAAGLALLFGAASDESVEARVAVKRIAQRLATLFATLKVQGQGQG